MSGIMDKNMIGNAPKTVSRRDLIKGVIAGSAGVSSAAYLFRASLLPGQSAGAAGERLITINVNGQQRRVDVMKQETLAWASLCMLCAHAHGTRPESSDDRRVGKRRRNAAPDTTKRQRRTRLPVRVLHARFHHGIGGISEVEPQSHED